MPLTFRRGREATTVSQENPLPVVVSQQTGALPTAPTAIDTLLIGQVIADTTSKDLLGNTGGEQATISNAKDYKRFLLVFHKSAAAEVTVTLKGRGADASGNPLGTGWATLATVSTSGNAAGHYRLVLEASDGKPLGCDLYRIEITSPSAQTVNFNLKGER